MNQVFRANGFLVYHTLRSIGSEPGYPDLCAVHPIRRELIFAELKMPKNQLTAAQETWLDALAEMDTLSSTTPRTKVYVWRPEDMDAIIRIAGGKELAQS